MSSLFALSENHADSFPREAALRACPDRAQREHPARTGLDRGEAKPLRFDHVELPVTDLQASADFYRRVLGPLGIEQTGEGECVEFGALTRVQRKPTEKLHIAFIAETREAVDRFHQAGLDAGYRDNGPPGIRERYAPDYYAAYLLDPDLHNIEAVHRSPETRRGWAWLTIGRE